MKLTDEINDVIEKYYVDKISTFGTTPAGVGWNGEESQLLRFQQILKIISKKEFSILDYGCGYGALYNYLIRSFSLNSFTYQGFDVVQDMIEAAQEFTNNNAIFSSEINSSSTYDFTVASGIFNLKPLHLTNQEWILYILEVLQKIDKLSTNGFAFNLLTIYSDQDKMKEDLFYADPSFFFDYCKKHFSRNVALLHDYNLYEFTILVRKS